MITIILSLLLSYYYYDLGSMLYVDEDRQYVSSKDAHDKNGNVMNNITLLTGHEGSLLKGTTITS